MTQTPPEIIADIKMANALIKQGQIDKVTYMPIEYKNKNILWWSVPEFLEENVQNKSQEELTGGTSFWVSRRQNMAEVFENQISPFINKKYTGSLWSPESESSKTLGYINPNNRFDFFNKIMYLAGASCNGQMGFHISGLYLDFDKFKTIFSMPVKEAEKLVDNNLFLGDIATFYSACIENGESFEKCEQIKSLYKKTLKLVESGKVHFAINSKPQEVLTFQKQKGQRLEYNEMLSEHISQIRKCEEKLSF